MFTPPSVTEVLETARDLGLSLSREDAEIYRTCLIESLTELDSFLLSGIEEHRPDVAYLPRERGHRPSREEDPFNAWLWKCAIVGSDDGVLRGRTVSYKDHIAVAGIPLTFGAAALDGLIPDVDATVVTRALEAGATIIGKNTMTGITGGYGFDADAGDFWPPRNPHSPGHMVGGTSSGSAVAVVTGDTDISFGGDQGGSARIPAAWTGCIGLKPTFGLISHFGAAFLSDHSVDHICPMALHIEDVAAALHAVAGYDRLDPRQDRSVPDGVDMCGSLADGIAGVKVGILAEGFTESADDVRDLVMQAADVLASAGAELTSVTVPAHREVGLARAALVEGKAGSYHASPFGTFAKTYYPATLMAELNRLLVHEVNSHGPWTHLQALLAEFVHRLYAGRVYAKAQNVRQYFVDSYDRALHDVDILLMPTCLTTAPPLARPRTHAEALELALRLPSATMAIRNTVQFNYTGHPALAMPCGKSNGLPVSVQFVGRRYQEELLCRVAYAYQHSVPYDDFVSIT